LLVHTNQFAPYHRDIAAQERNVVEFVPFRVTSHDEVETEYKLESFLQFFFALKSITEGIGPIGIFGVATNGHFSVPVSPSLFPGLERFQNQSFIDFGRRSICGY
jgi:hypothetical protein